MGCRALIRPYVKPMSFNVQEKYGPRGTVITNVPEFNVSTLPFQLSFQSCALFLDIDGTLLDIAPSPDDVQVPPDLEQTLKKLSQRMSSAMALLTGRQIDFVDRLFPDQQFAVAGLHGAERRDHSGLIERIEPDANFIKAKAYLRAISKKLPGVVFEDKHAAAALHFRNSPAMQSNVEHSVALAAEIAGTGWAVQRGKMVVELRPVGNDKGAALIRFMTEPIFSGRTPLVFGDDLTDEAMFRAAIEMGGYAVRIGDNLKHSCATALLPTPSDLRNWLTTLAVSER